MTVSSTSSDVVHTDHGAPRSFPFIFKIKTVADRCARKTAQVRQ